MSNRKRLLQINPEPIKLVPREQRDVWTKLPGWRCNHTDGRGQCTSRDTKVIWNKAERRSEAWCPKHMPHSEETR